MQTKENQPSESRAGDEISIGSDCFTDRKPFVVTADDVTQPWIGGENGKYFRCYLCGHKFAPGDVARWEYTNDIPDAGGNPMVCQKCDGPRSEVIAKWRALRAEFNHQRFWSFKLS